MSDKSASPHLFADVLARHKDRAKYMEIGESDRMTLRFRKPAQ